MTPNPRDRGAPGAGGPAAVSGRNGPATRPAPATTARPKDAPAPEPIAPEVHLPEPRLTATRIGKEPIYDWEGFYKEHGETPVDLMVRLTVLREKKYFHNIERALKAYMRHRPKDVNANLYELLAVAIKKNGGPEAEVKSALGWAGYLAKRGGQPMLLTSVADLMNVQGYPELTVTDARGKPQRTTIGELLDLASEQAPHLDRPLLMSINLAVKNHDSGRMIGSVEKLLSLGWPGRDEAYRLDARRVIETEAKRLEEDGKAEAAQSLRDRLHDAEQRDIYIRLTWEGDAWIGLSVEEPLGATASLDMPRTVFGGAIVKEGKGKDRESIYTAPVAFSGDYKVNPRVINYNEKQPVHQATLEIITHEGTPQEHRETRTLDLDHPAPVAFHLDDGRRKKVLPYLAPTRIQIVREKPSSPGAGGPDPKPTPPAARAAAKPRGR